MSTTRIEVDPSDPSTFPEGYFDPLAVDATTEADIARHKREDEAEALQDRRDTRAKFGNESA